MNTTFFSVLLVGYAMGSLSNAACADAPAAYRDSYLRKAVLAVSTAGILVLINHLKVA